jgi:hypothetical protein
LSVSPRCTPQGAANASGSGDAGARRKKNGGFYVR